MTAVPRVLMVTGAYHPELSAGGLQCRAVAALLKDRVDIRVLTTATSPSLPAHDCVDGIEVSRLFVRPGRRALGSAARLAGELGRLLPGSDLVHIQGFSSKNTLITAMAKLHRRPIIMHLQTARHDEPDSVRAQGRLAWWAYREADAVISVSPGLSQAYRDAGLPAQRVREIPNGVDTARFAPASREEKAALRQRLGLPAALPIVLFVGVMSPDKQPHVLLDAWLRLQDDPATACALVFVGATNPDLFELGDRLIEQLRHSIAQSPYRDRVVFAAPTTSVQDYFRAADVFALPSKREGLPIALLEGMSCGLACVASRLPGSTDTMIEDGVNGLLAAPGEAGALAGALAAAVRGERPGLGAAARRTVERRFSIAVVAEQWLTAYLELRPPS